MRAEPPTRICWITEPKSALARRFVLENKMAGPQVSFISLTDLELSALIGCAKRRLAVIAPGLSASVAKVLAAKWRELGPEAVQIVLDPDPEVCRLGWGELASLELLQDCGATILQQQGLRVGPSDHGRDDDRFRSYAIADRGRWKAWRKAERNPNRHGRSYASFSRIPAAD